MRFERTPVHETAWHPIHNDMPLGTPYPWARSTPAGRKQSNRGISTIDRKNTPPPLSLHRRCLSVTSSRVIFNASFQQIIFSNFHFFDLNISKILLLWCRKRAQKYFFTKSLKSINKRFKPRACGAQNISAFFLQDGPILELFKRCRVVVRNFKWGKRTIFGPDWGFTVTVKMWDYVMTY